MVKNTVREPDFSALAAIPGAVDLGAALLGGESVEAVRAWHAENLKAIKSKRGKQRWPKSAIDAAERAAAKAIDAAEQSPAGRWVLIGGPADPAEARELHEDFELACARAALAVGLADAKMPIAERAQAWLFAVLKHRGPWSFQGAAAKGQEYSVWIKNVCKHSEKLWARRGDVEWVPARAASATTQAVRFPNRAKWFAERTRDRGLGASAMKRITGVDDETQAKILNAEGVSKSTLRKLCGKTHPKYPNFRHEDIPTD